MIRIIVILCTLAGCIPDVQITNTCSKANATRCTSNHQLELCGPNGKWMTVMKCQDLGPGWTCDPVTETCVKDGAR